MARARGTRASKVITGEKRDTVTAEERHCMIAQVAYYRSQERGSVEGDPLADWLAAEGEIDGQLRQTD